MKIKLAFLMVVSILIGGCAAGVMVQLNFVDEQGEPVKNSKIVVQQRILCKESEQCRPPVVFEGKTNSQGSITLNSKIIWGNNILAEGHYVKPIHRGLKETEPHNVYDENLVVIDNAEHNLLEERELTIVLEKIK